MQVKVLDVKARNQNYKVDSEENLEIVVETKVRWKISEVI